MQDEGSSAIVSVEDRAYFEKRAETHLELAANATDPGVVKAHYLLANLYLDRIHGVTGVDVASDAPLFRNWSGADR